MNDLHEWSQSYGAYKNVYGRIENNQKDQTLKQSNRNQLLIIIIQETLFQPTTHYYQVAACWRYLYSLLVTELQVC